jgi:ERCC4-type nuclease
MQVEQLRVIVNEPPLARRLAKTIAPNQRNSDPISLLPHQDNEKLLYQEWTALHHQAEAKVQAMVISQEIEEYIAAIARLSQQVLPLALRQGWSLIIDTHERFLIPFFPPELAVVQTVNIADVWYMHHNEPCYMLERKSIQDISSARRSGTYANQKTRLLKSELAPHRISYLIEEDGSDQPIQKPSVSDYKHNNHALMSVETLLACQASTVHRDGLAWRYSKSTLYTVLLIYLDLRALCQHQHWTSRFPVTTLINQSPENEAADRQASNLSCVKSKTPMRMQTATTPQVDDPMIAWVRMLQQIKGVSVFKADGIQQKWNSMPIFVAHFAPLSKVRRWKELAAVKFQVQKRTQQQAKPKHLGPVIAKRVLGTIFG